MVSELSDRETIENVNASTASLNASPESSSLLLASQKAFVTFHRPISVKLDKKNFLLWRQQTLAAICGHELEKFIDADAEQPQKFTNSEEESVSKISDAYLAWNRQDQLLLSWLLSSMSESMITRVVGCESSSKVWDRIREFFVSQNRAKVRQFKTELRSTCKGDRPMNEYLLRIKTIVDSLIPIGNKVTQSEHIEAIFDGLAEECDTFIMSINTRLEPYSVSEVESLLIAQEIRQEKHNKINLTGEKASANVASIESKDKTTTNTNKSYSNFTTKLKLQTKN